MSAVFWRSKRKSLAIFFAVGSLVLTVACGSEASEPAGSSEQSVAAAPSATVGQSLSIATPAPVSPTDTESPKTVATVGSGSGVPTTAAATTESSSATAVPPVQKAGSQSSTPVAPAATAGSQSSAPVVPAVTAGSQSGLSPTVAANETVVAPSGPNAISPPRSEPPAETPVLVNTPGPVANLAPDFRLPSIQGPEYALSDFRGEQPVLVVFYRAYW